MRKILFLHLVFAFVLASCDYVGGERIKGNGNVKTEQRTVGNFSSVSSHGAFDVYLSQGAGFEVRIEAEENLLPYIEAYVNGDVLEINTKEGYWLKTRREMKVHVTAPSYTSVKTFGSGNIISQTQLNNTSPIAMEVAGSGDIRVQINAPEVRAEVRGSGNVNVAGETRNFVTEVQGSGDIRASNLKAETVNVDIAGSGSADVFASVKLNVDVRGSGDVKYRGGAQVSSDIAGSGSVKKVD